MATPANRQVDPPVTSDDLDRILRQTFIHQVDFHQRLSSTNDFALRLARQAVGNLPRLVLTEEQTAGRGRAENRWWSSRGALTFSLLIDAESARLNPRLWPKASLTVGLAVVEAIEDLLKRCDAPVDALGLKWPNDVYVSQRKLCGILVEVPPGRSDALVLGIGINVNNSLDLAPPALRSTATALCTLVDRPLRLVDVLVPVLQRLEQKLHGLGAGERGLEEEWKKRCLLTGCIVQLDVGGRQSRGLCLGIDGEGALLLETKAGRQRHFSGTITDWK